MSYQTAYRRWVGIGPYYAMFPTSFVEDTIKKYTQPGDWIFDPFAGRASSVFIGTALNRPAIGIEINPVGWVYGKTKTSPAPKEMVLARLEQISLNMDSFSFEIPDDFQKFFNLCFSEQTLKFLISARNMLDWRNSDVDRTLMAFILIDLHGSRQRSFSNQMRQSKAMAPKYSVRWWEEHKTTPPEIEPKSFMQKKIDWRYEKGIPILPAQSELILGDSTQVINDLNESYKNKIKLLFTSPPYIDVTDYHRDQWLRLWMLGEELSYRRRTEKYKATFASSIEYEKLLLDVFQKSNQLVCSDGYVYVRTDARKNTFEITLKVLKQCLPSWKYRTIKQPYSKNTQTALFGDKSSKPGEQDILFYR